MRGLRILAVLAALTAAACFVAAAGETWRFLLLLRGRTYVLAGPQVRASDVLVQAAAFTALVLGVVTAASAVSALAGLHRIAAEQAGRVPARAPAGTFARLVVPGWNLYGAGQILAEIVAELRRTDRRRRITRWAVPLWWAVWAVDGLLVFATLVMAFGRSAQWMADTVEMHIAVDLAGAATAGLFAAIVVSLHRSLTGRGPRPYDGWSVRPPESTARNRIGVVPGGAIGGGAIGDEVERGGAIGDGADVMSGAAAPTRGGSNLTWQSGDAEIGADPAVPDADDPSDGAGMVPAGSAQAEAAARGAGD